MIVLFLKNNILQKKYTFNGITLSEIIFSGPIYLIAAPIVISNSLTNEISLESLSWPNDFIHSKNIFGAHLPYTYKQKYYINTYIKYVFKINYLL